jgi:hypothetical protein
MYFLVLMGLSQAQTLQVTSMKSIFLLIGSLYANAGGGDGHSHGGGGETEHLYPIVAVFVVLIIIGFGVGHFLNKKK